MIRYKVVSKSYRSAILPYQSPFSLKYEIGTKVMASKETIGVMCFKTLNDAIDFATGFYNARILRVKPIGKGKSPKQIANLNFYRGKTYAIKSFYERIVKGFGNYYGTGTVPDGTICYPGVKVLSEIKEF